MMGTETEILLGVDEGRDLLDRDKVPNENQSLTCFSCGATMRGLYCHECGNKNDNYRRSIFSLIFELFENMTAMDGRMWRSLRSLLLSPGRMSRAFADGARQRWTSPVRMYIATSLILFGYITISDTQIVALGAIEESQAMSPIKVGTEDMSLSPKLIWFVKKSELLEITEDTELGGISREFLDGLQGDSDAVRNTPDDLREAIASLDAEIAEANNDLQRNLLQQTRNGLANSLQRMEADESDTNSDVNAPAIESPESESRNNVNITGFDGQEFTLDSEGLSAMYRLILRRPELINNRVNTEIKLAMFFMMPLAMLLGAIFIRSREKAMLYDHLVHAAYIHSFSFLLLFVFILLAQYTALPGLLIVYTLTLLIYLPWSAKGMFQRGWFKSCLTAYGVGTIYTFVIALIMIGIIALALQDIAVEVSEQQSLLRTSESPE